MLSLFLSLSLSVCFCVCYFKNVLVAAYKDTKRVFWRNNLRSNLKYKDYVYKEIESSSEVDVGYFCKTVRRFKQSSSTINVLKYNDIEANTAQGIVHSWINYFADLATENPESLNTKDIDTGKLSAESYSQEEPILSHQVACDEIVSVIKSLKNNKAPGPDCISNEHFKYAGNSFINHVQI